ncbi:MAG TPA: glycerophosphodiester phosphodiesterase [Patescibacteria group bacterium]|nr:glycerophosphodiester phosphodiesterase [Patescibacteria group bacterium]
MNTNGRPEAQAIEGTRARPSIIGHRGAAGHAPENTLASFSAAIALGVDAVEFDVQFTADGHPVVLHDETLGRMAGVPARIHDYTEAVLQGFDIGFLYGSDYRGLRVPAVADVARLVRPPIELHVEIKDYDPLDDDQIGALVETLARHGGLQRVVFSSPHEETITRILGLAPGVRAALLLFKRVAMPADAARRAAHIGCAAVNPDASLVTPELVQLCHRHDMQVLTFTVNERGTMRKLMQMDVDGFFSDYPDRLMTAILDGHDSENPAEDEAGR